MKTGSGFIVIFWKVEKRFELMKIVFANVINKRLPGVVAKMEAQAKALCSLVREGKFYAFYTGEQNELNSGPVCENGIVYVKLPRFAYKLATIALPRFLANYFRELNPDVVVLRSIPFSPMFWLAFREKNYRLIVEYHTKLMPELLVNRDYKHAMMSAISYGLADQIIDGKICMTREISNYEHFDGPTVVIPNGIDISGRETKMRKTYDVKCLRLGFVASQNHPWQGLDRLLRSLKANEDFGGPKCHLDVVGRLDQSEFTDLQLPRNVKFHGFLNTTEIAQILSQVDVGVSTLALHRKGMDEACALKSREYLVNSIPFIYGYIDPDFRTTDRFALRVPNNESLIDLPSVSDFAQRIAQNQEEITAEMRRVVVERLSWDVKIANYLKFADKVYSHQLLEV